ncbi:VWA domain-containing protein [Treponema sp. OttesenSCG-928-L16]|nr:VWA domain-containing protein [Treponema sp. OttesenSCG-928-L16]
MSFDNPGMLWFLYVLIPVILASCILYIRRRKNLSALFSAAGTKGRNVFEKEYRVRCAVSSVMFCIFLAALIVALAGPRRGTRLVPEHRRGLDVVLAFDLSRSMDVDDIKPSRMERALALGRELVLSSAGARFGLALGKGRGVIAVPLTDDTEAVLALLEGISGASVTGRGTNLEGLLEAASAAFSDAFPARRRIILFSDGESLSGSLSAAAEGLREKNIILVSVGLGTLTGGPVPGEVNGSGRPLISSLRPEALEAAAERTGGVYVDGSSGDAASRLTAHISEAASDTISGSFRREPKAQWHIFILIALIAFGISKSMEKTYGKTNG